MQPGAGPGLVPAWLAPGSVSAPATPERTSVALPGQPGFQQPPHPHPVFPGMPAPGELPHC